jgi:PKD domain/Bacterial Ig-like domain (group 3)
MHKPFLLLMAALMALVAVFSFTAPTTQAASGTINLTFSGSGGTQTWLQGEVVCDECLPDILHSGSGSWGIGGTVELDGQATWNPGPASTGLQYSAGNLRQGRTLDLVDTLTPQAGTVTIHYSVPITFGIFNTPTSGGSCGSVAACNALGWFPNPGETTSPTITASDAIPCTMPLPGESPRACTKNFEIPIFDGNLFSIIGAKITLPITETVNVTGSGVASVRVATAGGPTISNSNLNFAGTSPSSVPDPIAISCSQPVGADLLYSMTQNSYTADPMTWDGSVGLKIEATALGFSIPVINTTLVTLTGFGLGPVPMTAPDQQTDLGPVLPNNVPPTITSVGGPYTTGIEGTAVQFNGSASSVCGTPVLSWTFSDGGIAFGPNPQHTFVDDGVYSGLLTATDATGLTASQTFSVTISNANPTVDAGPDQQNDWGRTIFFHANGADAGAIDNGSLLYSWNFNDPFDPLGAAGQDVTHVYSQPGTYHPVVTVTDQDGATGTGTLTVTITKRDVTVAYLGGSAAQIGDTVPLSASIVDEYGQPVVGRLVTFTLDGAPVGSALTNTFGIAQTSFIAATATGAHTIVASFAGDALYKPGASSGTSTNFSVSKASAIFTYLGGLNGSPSKPLVLTAKLLDQNGKPVAGKLVTMAVGSQSCSAITNPSGIASCTITKLTQKPGKYLLSLNFGGTADYNSAGLTAVFTIGNANG